MCTRFACGGRGVSLAWSGTVSKDGKEHKAGKVGKDVKDGKGVKGGNGVAAGKELRSLTNLVVFEWSSRAA